MNDIKWNFKYSIVEENKNEFACNVKTEPKPEIPLLVLHSLPSVVSANPADDDDFSAKGFARSLEISYKPAPKSRKARQFNTRTNYSQVVQRAPPIASDDEEINYKLLDQDLDSKVPYKRFIPDSEEKGGTMNVKEIEIKHDSAMEKQSTSQDLTSKRGRRKSIKACCSQHTDKRKSKVKKPDTTKKTPKQKPKKEVKSELYEHCNKFSSVVACDSKVSRGRKPRRPSVKKVNSESNSNSRIKGRHIRTGDKKVLLCEYCSAVFTRYDYLKLHMMLHTNERPYKCDICKKSFRMRWQVRLHHRIHSNVKPYECQFCSYCSIRKDALRAHCRNIHKNVVVCDMKDCLLEHAH